MAEMEKGYRDPPAADDSAGVKAARKLAGEDYPRFLATYLKALELTGGKEPVPTPDEAAPVAAAAAGPKEERLDQLAERLLTEWEAEDAQSQTGPDPEVQSG